MIISLQQIQHYLVINRGKEIPGEDFTFDLHPPKERDDIFPYTIEFKNPEWSEDNVSSIGPEKLQYYLCVFNQNNDAPASAYKNRMGEGTESKNARYLVKILKLFVKQQSEIKK